MNYHLNVPCASLPESRRLWPCSERRLVIYNLLDPALHVQHLLEHAQDHGTDTYQDSKVIPGEVAEATLAQPFYKTLNGG